MSEVELWIRLTDGDAICMRYDRPEEAWSVRHRMMEQLAHGDYIQCVRGDIPASGVKSIDFVAHIDDD